MSDCDMKPKGKHKNETQCRSPVSNTNMTQSHDGKSLADIECLYVHLTVQDEHE